MGDPSWQQLAAPGAGRTRVSPAPRGVPCRASSSELSLAALPAGFLPRQAPAGPRPVPRLPSPGQARLGSPSSAPCGTTSPRPAQTVCPRCSRVPGLSPRPAGQEAIHLAAYRCAARADLLLLAVSNLCHLYSLPSLNLQYTFCFSLPQPLSPPSTLMRDMCGIHLGIYLKTISHPGFNTFPHQGST